MKRFGVVVAVLGAVGLAWAKPHYSRSPQLHIAVQLTDDVRPVSATKSVVPSAYAQELPDPYGKARASDEHVLIDLIESTPDKDADEKAALYHRLGALYAKESVTARHNGQTKQAKEYLLKAVKVLKTLTVTETFKAYPKMDAALYSYGYVLYDSKYMKEARAELDQLIKNYPTSPYVAQAHLVFAEYYVDSGQIADAEPRYALAAKDPKSTVYPYAQYRLAHVQLELAKFKDAYDGFDKAAQATAGDGAQQPLYRASVRGLLYAYAQIGKPDTAFDTFAKADPTGALDLYAGLADLYLAMGKTDEATSVYRDLLKRDPKSAHACAWQYGAAHALLSAPGASNDDKVVAIEELVRQWSAVKAKKALPADEAQECRDHAAHMADELAHAWHDEGTKTRNADTFGYAERLYKAYIDAFPDGVSYAEDQYLYAEALWASAELAPTAAAWKAASDAFTAVGATNKLDTGTLNESATAAVYARRNSEQP